MGLVGFLFFCREGPAPPLSLEELGMVVREVWGGAWPSEVLRLFLWRGQTRAVRDGAWPHEVTRGRAYRGL